MARHMPQSLDDRVFFCIMPTGFWWADRKREVDGDYARLAFLPFSTLDLQVFPDCPPELQTRITTEAARIQAKAGSRYQISTAGQTITLGHQLEHARPKQIVNQASLS